MIAVGRLHMYGWGVPENRPEARRWFEAAVRRDSLDGMYELGHAPEQKLVGRGRGGFVDESGAAWARE